MQGWQTRPIGEAFRVVNGGTPKTGAAAYWDGPHQWITPAEMGGRPSPYLAESRRTLTDEGLRVGAELVPPKSVILSSRAPIGHLVINEVPMAFNQGCKGLVPSSAIDTKFAYYFLLANVPLLESLGTGATFKELSSGKLKEVSFHYPPLPEQRRVVAILDEAFEAIATAKANTEKNLQNAQELFDNELVATFDTSRRTWPVETLGSLCLKVTDGTHNSPPYVEAGVPMLDSKHIRDDFEIDGSRADKFISREVDDMLAKRCKPQAGDILISSRGTIGKIAIVRDGQDFNIMGNMILLRVPPTVDRAFIAFYVLSRVSHIESIARGVAQKGLYLSQVRDYKVPVPSIGEQQRIAQRIEQLQTLRADLCALLDRKLAALDELKKSLLHQAFTGQLTSSKPVPVGRQAALQTTTPQFAANVIAIAYARHEMQKRDKTFGRVKEQKLLHLVEAIGKLDLGRRPIKDAAGPNDFAHMHKAEAWAKDSKFFEMVKRDGRYDFRKLEDFEVQRARAAEALGPHLGKIEAIIDLLIPMDSEEAEVFATVHAAWNNLLIDGAEITDDRILLEARDRWHPDKLEIPKHKFNDALKLIRSKGLIPDGTGKYVRGQQQLV